MKEHLIGKASAGLLSLLVIMAALIFVPAWTVDYLQAWLYLLTFAGSTIWITLYLYKNDQALLQRRVEGGPSAEKETKQKIIQTAASIAFCLVYIVAGLDHRFHWSEVPVAVSILADCVVAVGFFIVFLVFKENSFTSAVIEVNEKQKIVSTGPYAVVRHPMYSGASLMMLASSIALASYWSLLCTFFLMLSIVLRLLDEERFLLDHLPGYREYCEKVSYHLIPFIW